MKLCRHKRMFLFAITFHPLEGEWKKFSCQELFFKTKVLKIIFFLQVSFVLFSRKCEIHLVRLIKCVCSAEELFYVLFFFSRAREKGITSHTHKVERIFPPQLARARINDIDFSSSLFRENKKWRQKLSTFKQVNFLIWFML